VAGSGGGGQPLGLLQLAELGVERVGVTSAARFGSHRNAISAPAADTAAATRTVVVIASTKDTRAASINSLPATAGSRWAIATAWPRPSVAGSGTPGAVSSVA
jgi:hypothetical protein